MRYVLYLSIKIPELLDDGMSWSWSGETLDWRSRREENMLWCATCCAIDVAYLSIKIPELLDDGMSSWSGDTLDWRRRREENMLSDFCEKYRDILLAWNNIILINNIFGYSNPFSPIILYTNRSHDTNWDFLFQIGVTFLFLSSHP